MPAAGGRCGRETTGVALNLSAAPAGAVRAAHRRVARALLAAEARRLGGAARLAEEDAAGGDPALLGVPEGEARRVAALLERLFGPAVAPGLTEIRREPDGPDLVFRAPRPDPEPQRRALAGLDGRIAALPLSRVLRRETLLRLRPGEPPALAGLRLGVETEALAAALGPDAAEDADLLGHAEERLALRLVSAVADPAERRALLGGAESAAPLFLALPPDAAREAAARPGGSGLGGGPPGGIVLMLPLAAIAERAGLPAAGPLAIALDGLDAETLGLIAPDAGVLAAADRLALRWSPRLAEDRAAAAALRRLDPARLLLLGCDGTEALDWGAAQGIERFGGPWVGRMLAAARRLACRHAAACVLADCAARASATDAAGRAGCADLRLLAATPLPPGGDPPA
ncbi:hypothetical protein GCM10010964_13820 [Caldovatus sediminis]|uniref:Uncharacterized protein n=1 Tax=Caldovatus sediminis TaxID=2041189 RepID=A0A8J3EBK9_9PROT|nr:hypothetical protein GCM10010964_13820 [Caldovatus sediminis]